MKKHFLFILILLFALNSFSQKNNNYTPFCSLGISGNYIHYKMDPVYHPQFNWGIGLDLSVNFNKFKVTCGGNYCTKNYSCYTPKNNINKTVFNLEYFNVPIIFGIKLAKDTLQKNIFLLNMGAVINSAFNFRSKSYYTNGSVLNDKLNFEKKIGVSARLGIGYEREISKKIGISIDAYSDIKLIREYYKYVPSPTGFTGNLQNKCSRRHHNNRILAGRTSGIA